MTSEFEKFKVIYSEETGKNHNVKDFTPGRHGQGETLLDKLTSLVDTKIQCNEALMRSLSDKPIQEVSIETLSENEFPGGFVPWDDTTKKEIWKTELENTLNEFPSEQKALFLRELHSLGEQVYTSIAGNYTNMPDHDQRLKQFHKSFNHLPVMK